MKRSSSFDNNNDKGSGLKHHPKNSNNGGRCSGSSSRWICVCILLLWMADRMHFTMMCSFAVLKADENSGGSDNTHPHHREHQGSLNTAEALRSSSSATSTTRLSTKSLSSALNTTTVQIDTSSSSNIEVPWWSTTQHGQYILREPQFWRHLGVSVDDRKQEKIQQLLVHELCRHINYDFQQQKCHRQAEAESIKKSVFGSGHDNDNWYSLTAPIAGAIFARVNEHTTSVDSVAYVNTSMYTSMDFIVPLANQERVDKLSEFVTNMNAASRNFAARNMQFRLLVSMFPEDVRSFRKLVKDKLKRNKSGKTQVVVVPCEPAADHQFNRAATVNCLLNQACQGDDCAVALIDIDIKVSTPFVVNALSYIKAGSAIYLPFVYMERNPQTIQLIDHVTRKGNVDVRRIHYALEEDYHGLWRQDGAGMWVMVGSDAATRRMDESFVGWGGEDLAFYQENVDKFNVVRVRDAGLLHPFHEKNCKGVADEFKVACRSSALKEEGTPLGIYLQNHPPEKDRHKNNTDSAGSRIKKLLRRHTGNGGGAGIARPAYASKQEETWEEMVERLGVLGAEHGEQELASKHSDTQKSDTKLTWEDRMAAMKGQGQQQSSKQQLSKQQSSRQPFPSKQQRQLHIP